ncbi:fungal-specific transcription factor domain-containing protein [Rhodofomes roseus]|uniref:Fungal-specific transcription factor domain-containing protein n=1 Tax=Rhodofomes roseus TaxID=34475 RepID=A0ABQ8KHM7_9APHY|nr:fungal-specific transcription factor domain-containing protein [Rhodofomes roseus]KAH9837369.1 fungal-specific transcription factor domain-containing protein [Rhodofomes roseus]
MAPAEKDKTANGEPKPRRRPGRVPVSCAECRRLKLRCDRKVPCETCVKRGCSAICPEGSLTTGKGNRLALADAEELHKKIERLRDRCGKLEYALRTLQAAVSDEPHPLLREESSMDVPPSVGSSGSSPGGPLLTQEDEEILDAFGTLTLGIRGEARFFGQTSRSEYLIHAPTRTTPPADSFPRLSALLVAEAQLELDTPCRNTEIRHEIYALMPSLSQACRLCEIFMEYGQYIWFPMPRAELFDDILGSVYKTQPDSACNIASTHAFSVLYMVFALATLFDPNVAPYSVEAHEYYVLSRICLRCAPPIHDTTLHAIQSLLYQAQYLEMSDCEPAHTGSHKAWLTIGLAMKLGHGIGLHVNSTRWKLDYDAGQRRARVFWQLFFQDTWQSFGFGRPPSMCLSFVDCPFAKDPEERINAQGQKEGGYHAWTWQYTKLLSKIIFSVFGAKTPQYSAILEYDRMVRDFPVPVNLRPNCGQNCGEPIDLPVPQFMQRFWTLTQKEATLLSLHRPWFAQALHEQPGDLLRHRYGPSVMAIYRSAWRIIESAREAHKRAGVVASRIGAVWSQCLAAGIVMCLLVTRAPTSALAASSLQELDVLLEVFEQAAVTSQIASNNLEVVRKLRGQGYEVLHKPRTPGESTANAIIDRELDRLGGKTHLISSMHEPPLACTPAKRSNESGSNSSSSPASGSSGAVSSDMIHPTIMQDLRVFEGIDVASLSTSGASSALDVGQYNFADVFNGMQPQQGQAMPLHQQQQIHPQQMQQPPVPGPDIFDELFGAQAFPPEPEPPVGPPVLDATWQSFIEQLGF